MENQENWAESNLDPITKYNSPNLFYYYLR